MIRFGVWAPSKDVFLSNWRAAGILDADNQLLPPYAGQLDCNFDSWPGIIEDTPATFDEAGNITQEATTIPGWHTNARVYGAALLAQFMAGLAQVNGDGSPKSIWERTHAASVFQLTYKAADPSTGFPEGYQSAAGVVYADADAISSPANVF